MKFDLDATLAANGRGLMQRIEMAKAEMLAEKAERERREAEESRRRDAEWRALYVADRAAGRAESGQVLPWKKDVA